jgi:uncharacterized protein Veg
MDKLEIDKIRATIQSKLKETAILTIQKGRNRKVSLPVTIESVHPNHFTFKEVRDESQDVDWAVPAREKSFTYVDLLTNSVELAFAEI